MLHVSHHRLVNLVSHVHHIHHIHISTVINEVIGGKKFNGQQAGKGIYAAAEAVAETFRDG